MLRYCTAFFTRRSSLLPPASSEPRVTGCFASAPTRPGCIQPHGFACPRLFFLMQAREGVNLLSGKNATDGKASETHSASNETVRWGGAVACAFVGGWVGGVQKWCAVVAGLQSGRSNVRPPMRRRPCPLDGPSPLRLEKACMCAVLTAFSAAPQVVVSYFKPNVTLAMVDDFRCEPS